MYKCVISGYYLSGKDKVEYNDVEVTIPNCPESMILGNIINRVVHRKFCDAKKPYYGRGVCYVDKYTKDDRMKPSFNGKYLKELNWEELQDLAIAYSLIEVPLFRSMDLRTARQIAYRAYCNKVKGQNLDMSFDYVNAPDVLLGDGKNTSEAE